MKNILVGFKARILTLLLRGTRVIRFLRRQGPAQGAESEDQKNKLLPPPPGCHDGPGSVGVKPGKELRSILLDECRHLTHPRRWQDGDPRQKTRTAGAQKEKLLSCRRRAGLSSSGAELSKTFVPFTADVRGGQRLGEQQEEEEEEGKAQS